MSNQLAVLFPGIGYHIDKPLLYYSAKTCTRTRLLPARGAVSRSADRFKRSHRKKSNKLCRPRFLPQRNSLPPSTGPLTTAFSSSRKSIGTAIAARYAVRQGIHPRQGVLHTD